MEAQQSKWETVKSLFEAAQGIAPEKLSEFLATRCQDKEVCAEVERLLREYREAESFLSTPAVGRISVSPRSAGGIRFEPSQHLHGLRNRQSCRPRFHRDGVIGRPDVEAAHCRGTA